VTLGITPWASHLAPRASEADGGMSIGYEMAPRAEGIPGPNWAASAQTLAPSFPRTLFPLASPPPFTNARTHTHTALSGQAPGGDRVKGESECRRGESKGGERDHGDGSKDLLLGIELLYQVGDALVFFVALDFPSRVFGLPHS